MWRTNLGRQRISFIKRQPFLLYLSKLPSITPQDCCHWQCGCGEFKMVSYKGRVYCQTCGRVRCYLTQNGKGYYTPNDIKYCNICSKDKALLTMKEGK